MGDILADVRRELSEKGWIDQNLLAWGRRKVMTFTNHEMFFFGIKDGSLMILPFVDFKNISFDEVKYYTKESIKSINYSSFTSILQIEFSNKSSGKYSAMQGSQSDMQKIVQCLKLNAIDNRLKNKETYPIPFFFKPGQ